MNVLAIDRSTDVQSVAFLQDGALLRACVFDGADARSADWPVRVHDFLSGAGVSFCDLDQIVVGMGPGSFAGIRGALSFAQGLAIGIRAKRRLSADVPIVYGLPSAAALARKEGLIAVVGDARRGRLWVVVYHGAKVVSDFRLVGREELFGAVPETAEVATPDGARIGGLLGELFGKRFTGNQSPAAERLALLAARHPELPVPEPLPIYLSPAVRKDE